MSRSLHRAPLGNRRRTALVALGAGLAIALAGCSAGQITQTSTQRSAVDGVSYTHGSIEIRDASIEAPAPSGWETGDTAGISMVVVNNALADDEITGIEIDGESVTVAGDDAASSESTAESSASGSAESSASETAESSASGSASESAAETTTEEAPAAAESSPLTVPAQGKAVISAGGDAEATFEVPSGPLYTSMTLPITITFRDAGEVTFDIVVSSNGDEVARDPDSQVDLHHGDEEEDEEGGH